MAVGWRVGWLGLLAWAVLAVRALPAGEPVVVGMSAEFSLLNSTSAQAIRLGIEAAITEVNAQGGVLGGRPLRLEFRDDRSVPARGIHNLRRLAQIPDLVAVFYGRFSPVVMEVSPVAHELGVILLDPWASADAITQHGLEPNYAFRLSLKDSLAMPAMLEYAKRQGWLKLGILLPNTGWGRSNEAAAERYVAEHREFRLVKSRWYNWGDASLLELYQDLLQAGAQAVLLVANDREGSILLKEIVALPPAQWRPLLSHWGVTGGKFFEAAQAPLRQLDFTVVQTFSFFNADPLRREQFLDTARSVPRIENYPPVTDYPQIASPVGVAHAYDLTHLLALAINQAGSTDRAAVRDALENLEAEFSGLVKHYRRPFSPGNHDALGQDSVFMARYRDDGVLVPLP